MIEHTCVPRSVQFEEAENTSTNASANATMGDVIAERLSRRDLAKGILAVSAMAATVSPLALLASRQGDALKAANTTPSFNFKEVVSGVDDKHYVAEGYDADILIRWGDPVLPGAPRLRSQQADKGGQAKQFGYNNDYLGYFPLPGAANPSEHGLLCVNHEYTNEELMFPGLGRQDARRGSTTPFSKMTKEIAEVEMMAHGGSVLEVRRTAGKWAVVANSKYARRITGETEMRISGPAAGHDRTEDRRRPERKQGARHAQQLRRRPHAMGHLVDVRGKHQRLLHRRAWRRSSRRRATTGGWAFPAAGTIGATISIASTSPRSPTRPIASAGWWRSIRSTRHRYR